MAPRNGLAVDEQHDTLAVLLKGAPHLPHLNIRAQGLGAGEHCLADGQRERLPARETVS
jgi:hypothetical protein